MKCEKTKWFCPNCSAQNVYVDESREDYYQGSPHYCISCVSVFYLLDVCEATETSKEQINKIKSENIDN